jgi:hypothetical protein
VGCALPETRPRPAPPRAAPPPTPPAHDARRSLLRPLPSSPPQGGDSAPVKAKAAAASSSSGSGVSFGLLLPLLLIVAAIVFQLYLKK